MFVLGAEGGFHVREVTDATIESALAKLENLPTPVTSWLVKTGLDWADDPAVWVWALLAKEEVAFESRSKLRAMVREQIRQEIGDGPFVYVMVRGDNETA